MRVVLPAPLTPIRQVSTPGRKAPLMPTSSSSIACSPLLCTCSLPTAASCIWPGTPVTCCWSRVNHCQDHSTISRIDIQYSVDSMASAICCACDSNETYGRYYLFLWGRSCGRGAESLPEPGVCAHLRNRYKVVEVLEGHGHGVKGQHHAGALFCLTAPTRTQLMSRIWQGHLAYKASHSSATKSALSC